MMKNIFKTEEVLMGSLNARGVRFFAVAILLTLFSSAFASGDATKNAQIKTGVNFSPGLFYNFNWDPVYNGSSYLFVIEKNEGPFTIGLGAELGYSYTGFHALFPISASFPFAETKAALFLLTANILPGIMLGRPHSYFLIGGEFLVGAKRTLTKRFSLEFLTGPRYLTSPDYSNKVYDHTMLDLTIGLYCLYHVR